MDLPLDLLRSIAREQLEPGGSRPLFLTISGAHLYGFASPDSDFDLRGAHVAPLRSVVSLRPPPETLEFSGERDGRELDFVSHDVRKFFGLMLRRNGYVMEQIFSPLAVTGGPLLEELRDIARGCLTRNLYHHYSGFLENQLELLAKEAPKRVKTLLYVYRVALTGIHVLAAGEIESHLPRLLVLHPLERRVNDLIAAKTREKTVLDEAEYEAHGPILSALRARLVQASKASNLPAEPGSARDLDDFLVRLRTALPPLEPA
jgi:predicted nucleotidyltransferase